MQTQAVARYLHLEITDTTGLLYQQLCWIDNTVCILWQKRLLLLLWMVIMKTDKCIVTRYRGFDHAESEDPFTFPRVESLGDLFIFKPKKTTDATKWLSSQQSQAADWNLLWTITQSIQLISKGDLCCLYVVSVVKVTESRSEIKISGFFSRSKKTSFKLTMTQMANKSRLGTEPL